MTTLPFGPRNREPDPLLARAAELPKDIAPPRDLWPAIAARLTATPQRAGLRALGWPAALAAGFLVASVSALLTWGLMREPGPAVAAITPVQYGPNSALGANDLATRDQLLVQFRQRLDGLSPQTREAVVKNLAIIQRAADEIDAALAQDPASGLLSELLLGAYKQELQLYSRRT
jgi:hypothetical protein